MPQPPCMGATRRPRDCDCRGHDAGGHVAASAKVSTLALTSRSTAHDGVDDSGDGAAASTRALALGSWCSARSTAPQCHPLCTGQSDHMLLHLWCLLDHREPLCLLGVALRQRKLAQRSVQCAAAVHRPPIDRPPIDAASRRPPSDGRRPPVTTGGARKTPAAAAAAASWAGGGTGTVSVTRRRRRRRSWLSTAPFGSGEDEVHVLLLHDSWHINSGAALRHLAPHCASVAARSTCDRSRDPTCAPRAATPPRRWGVGGRDDVGERVGIARNHRGIACGRCPALCAPRPPI